MKNYQPPERSGGFLFHAKQKIHSDLLAALRETFFASSLLGAELIEI